MSDQILATVDTYLEKKIANVKSIQQKLYRDGGNWRMITEELKNPAAERLSAYQRQELNNAVIQTYYSIDKDLNGIFLFGSQEENMLQFGSSQSNAEYSFSWITAGIMHPTIFPRFSWFPPAIPPIPPIPFPCF